MADYAKEYRKKSGHTFRDFVSKIGPSQIIVVGVIFAILVAFSNNPNLDQRYSYIGYFILLAIIGIMYFKPGPHKALLDEETVKHIAQEALNTKMREGNEFSFDSKVFVTSACDLKYEHDFVNGTSGPVGWDVGFVEYVKGTQYKKEGVIRIHPYEGIVTGLRFYPLGYTGRESKDRDIVPVGVIQGNVKTTDFGGGPNKPQ